MQKNPCIWSPVIILFVTLFLFFLTVWFQLSSWFFCVRCHSLYLSQVSVDHQSSVQQWRALRLQVHQSLHIAVECTVQTAQCTIYNACIPSNFSSTHIMHDVQCKIHEARISGFFNTHCVVIATEDLLLSLHLAHCSRNDRRFAKLFL